MSIISTSGKINSGKDTVGKIIRILTASPHFTNEAVVDFLEKDLYESEWQIKKFADKLKDIVCMLLGCTREQLEDREFKEKELGEEWIQYFDSDYELLQKESVLSMFSERLTPRKLLQIIGTECIRDKVHPNAWVNALMSEYKPKDAPYNSLGDLLEDRHNGLLNNPNWVITDMRFPNELEAVKSRGGITIRVNRTLPCGDVQFNGTQEEWEELVKKNKEQSAKFNHPSETALDNAEFDYVIDNDSSIEELIDKVREILTEEKLL